MTATQPDLFDQPPAPARSAPRSRAERVGDLIAAFVAGMPATANGPPHPDNARTAACNRLGWADPDVFTDAGHAVLRMLARVDPDETGGRTGRTHPDTSRRAAAGVKVGTQHAAIVADLDAAGDWGATAHDLAVRGTSTRAKRPGITANQVGARLLELRERGIVAAKTGPHGEPATRRAAASDAVVHILTDAGRAEARRLATRAARP